MIYHEETMKKMAGILEKKEKEIGHEIYLISDEPYRELVYDGNQEDFLTKYYRNTIVGYSFSKSLSLPGERIGYVVVPDEVENNQFNGQGTLIMTDGTKYKGGFVNGMEEGNGIQEDKNGNRYEGFFKQGKKHGPFVETDKNGKVIKKGTYKMGRLE